MRRYDAVDVRLRLFLGALVFVFLVTLWFWPPSTHPQPPLRAEPPPHRAATVYCPLATRVAVRNLTALSFAPNQTACIERTYANGRHHVYQMQPNGDAVARSVLCVQQGWDGTRLHWRCEALPRPGARTLVGFKDASAHITCEGWAGPDDREFVRSDSCYFAYEVQVQPELAALGPQQPLVVYATGWIR